MNRDPLPNLTYIAHQTLFNIDVSCALYTTGAPSDCCLCWQFDSSAVQFLLQCNYVYQVSQVTSTLQFLLRFQAPLTVVTVYATNNISVIILNIVVGSYFLLFLSREFWS